jgi:hypothetical protein
MLSQLTIRGFDPALEAEIQRLAKAEGISLNQAVLRLLRKGAGVGQDNPDLIGHALDGFIGDWTHKEASRVDKLVADFEHIDPELWK